MQLTKLCAANFIKLNTEFKAKWGHNIPLDDAYRSYTDQVKAKAQYGAGAAAPGYSNHGYGAAVDMPDYRLHYSNAFDNKLARDLKVHGPMWQWLVKAGANVDV
jgi:LAS superfamily LD-carboxypeptidase LdcB